MAFDSVVGQPDPVLFVTGNDAVDVGLTKGQKHSAAGEVASNGKLQVITNDDPLGSSNCTFSF